MDYKDPITNPNYEGGRAKVSLRPFCPAPSVKKKKEKKKVDYWHRFINLKKFNCIIIKFKNKYKYC